MEQEVSVDQFKLNYYRQRLTELTLMYEDAIADLKVQLQVASQNLASLQQSMTPPD
jgi:hypothetical protein